MEKDMKYEWKKTASGWGLEKRAGLEELIGSETLHPDDLSWAVAMAQKEAVEYADLMGGHKWRFKMKKISDVGYPSFAQSKGTCSTPEQQEECWTELKRYCRYLSEELEEMRHELRLSERHVVDPLSCLKRGKTMNPAPREHEEMGAERRSSDRTERGFTERAG